jgi:hypothetical protein
MAHFIHFGLSSANLNRIRIKLVTDAEVNLDPTFQFYADPSGSGSTALGCLHGLRLIVRDVYIYYTNY